MLSNLSKMGRRAFTLVELIIVIVIVGILAAISIVGYQAVVDRAEEAAAEATLDSADREIRAMLAFEVAGNGTVDADAGQLAADLAAIDVTYTDVDGNGFVSAGDTIMVETTSGDEVTRTLSGNATTPAS